MTLCLPVKIFKTQLQKYGLRRTGLQLKACSTPRTARVALTPLRTLEGGSHSTGKRSRGEKEIGTLDILNKTFCAVQLKLKTEHIYM